MSSVIRAVRITRGEFRGSAYGYTATLEMRGRRPCYIKGKADTAVLAMKQIEAAAEEYEYPGVALRRVHGTLG